MNVNQNSSAIGEARAGSFLGRLFSLVSKDLVLDFIERTIVLILFLYFANRMLRPLAVLITAEIAYPELLWLAASNKPRRSPIGDFRIARRCSYPDASVRHGGVNTSA